MRSEKIVCFPRVHSKYLDVLELSGVMEISGKDFERVCSRTERRLSLCMLGWRNTCSRMPWEVPKIMRRYICGGVATFGY